jgi:putative DNA primase/helicase
MSDVLAVAEWRDVEADPEALLELGPDAPAGPSIEQSDLGNARRLVAANGDDLRYVPEWHGWLAWDGRRWKPDLTGEVDRMAKRVTDTMRDEAHAAGDDKRYSFAVKSQGITRLRAAVDLAATEPGIPVLVDQLDADPWRLSVANGTLDLRTGQLLPHRREDLITKVTDVAWDPEATCPAFNRFMERILPDDEVRDFVQRATGYSLTGDVSEQVIFIEHGTGSNGKSTFKELQLRILGEHAKPAAPKLLLAKSHDEHPTAIADLQGRRLVVAHEVEDGMRLDEALVKELTGGDRLKARFMRQDYFDFTPTHKLWLACNHKPAIKGTDHGIWRRIRLIPFDVTIGDDEKDPHLLDTLCEELPGILAWAVAGCTAWQRDGLEPPQAVIDATDRYRVDSDLLSQFIEERCVTGPHAQAAGSALYATYRAWCGDNGLTYPLSQKALSKQLSEKGLERTENRQHQRIWTGIGLLDATERPENTLL